MTNINDEFNRSQYNRYVQYYLDSNTDEHIGGGTASARVKLLKKHLAAGSNIFEIGSGGGTDALALQQAGYKITASDAASEFIKVLKSKSLSAALFDAKHDSLPEGYDAIYANAVFVHFSPGQLTEFAKKAKEKLEGSRIIYCSVIKGEGTERRKGSQGFDRDFQYYSEKELNKLFSENGYSVIELRLVDSRWIQIIAQAKQ